MTDIDQAFSEDEPPALTDSSTTAEKEFNAKWERSNRLCILAFRRLIAKHLKSGLPETINTKRFHAQVEERYLISNKAETRDLMNKLAGVRYDFIGSVRDYILKMVHIQSKLKTLEITLPDIYIVQSALKSLPAEFNQMKTTYNTQYEPWSISKCIVEEEKIKGRRVRRLHRRVVEGCRKERDEEKGRGERDQPLLLIWKEDGIWLCCSVTCLHIVYLGHRSHDDHELITDSHHDILGYVIGSKEEAKKQMVYSYRHGFSGFAAKLTNSQAKKIRVMVKKKKKTMGKKTMVGRGLQGIWGDSEAFNDKGLGPIPSRWKGSCKSEGKFNATKHCNKKVIGARWYIKGLLEENELNQTMINKLYELSALDEDGHGTHVAYTTAGSYVNNIQYYGLNMGTVRGGAPLARLAIYKVSWKGKYGHCSGADILAAIDDAIKDGVDILSASLDDGHNQVDFNSLLGIGSFHAVSHGIPFVAAGGNDGPESNSIINTSPWMINVAANNEDREIVIPLTLGNNETILAGGAIFKGKEPAFAPLVVDIDTTNNQDPIINLGRSEVLQGKEILVKVSRFSSRGPNSIAPEILKPDVAAPGENIIAAVPPRLGNNGFKFMSGTSMATPHVTGIVALLKVVHPNWSPAAIKSSLVTTGNSL
ncbi:Subtilisin-like protease SBT3.3 [Capsicum baccatum]|uniref:Subtilisin-like protease SBT3.3 n=1 Tax=Capsicum baccatum TaxID=33114 RepID=A0A2G2W4B3_CAPBA|nr:Subtilisin-like protease SBT3.3 [Capsicum baccatum]